jgi:hypothetical protein
VCFKGIEDRLLELITVKIVIRRKSAYCVLQNEWGVVTRFNTLETAILYSLPEVVLQKFVLAVL